jgi:hypothetical protein
MCVCIGLDLRIRSMDPQKQTHSHTLTHTHTHERAHRPHACEQLTHHSVEELAIHFDIIPPEVQDELCNGAGVVCFTKFHHIISASLEQHAPRLGRIELYPSLFERRIFLMGSGFRVQNPGFRV